MAELLKQRQLLRAYMENAKKSSHQYIVDVLRKEYIELCTKIREFNEKV